MVRRPKLAATGFTMIELLVTMGIVAITIGLAVPSVRSVMQNSRAAGISNEFVATLNYVRSEAVKRRNTVRICTSADGATCRAAGSADVNNWHKGWIVLDPAGNVLRRSNPLNSEIQVTAGAGDISFAGTGGVVAATAPTFTVNVTGCTGNNNRSLSVSVTGRVTVTRTACP